MNISAIEPLGNEPTPMREGLPPLPDRMKHLPIDSKGYPVPYFVAWVDGKPDHRVADSAKMPNAVRFNLCWMCGQKLGAFKAFCIGPMCSITRTISEPPSHIECVRYAAMACPFMTRPMAQRREANLPEQRKDAAGFGIKRNPGSVCLWVTKTYTPFRDRNGGRLFEIGDPTSTEWYTEGRPSTRAEVDESIRTGLPLLYAPAAEQGYNAVMELARRVMITEDLLTAVLGPSEVQTHEAGDAA